MKIRMEWEEFVDLAKLRVLEVYPTADVDTIFFGKRYSHEPDGEAYDKPDFIEIEI